MSPFFSLLLTLSLLLFSHVSRVHLCDPMDCSPPGSSVHGKNTGAGCHFLLQGIFPTQGLNRHLLRRQADSQPLSHQGLLTYYLKKDTCCVK